MILQMPVRNQRPKRILIADDSQSARDLLRYILEHYGFEVIEAVDGEEVLDKAGPSAPDMFILDVNMPVRDGRSAAEELRKFPVFTGTPILAISSVTPVEWSNSGGSPFDEFLSKPVSPSELRACVMQLLQKR